MKLYIHGLPDQNQMAALQVEASRAKQDPVVTKFEQTLNSGSGVGLTITVTGGTAEEQQAVSDWWTEAFRKSGFKSIRG